MKKLLALILVFLIGLSLFVACSPVDEPIDDNPADGTPTYLYTDFTDEEKAAFVDLVGETIPFLPCNEYSVVGNAEAVTYTINGAEVDDFITYRSLMTGYEYKDAYIDDIGGKTWHIYEKELADKNVIRVEMSYSNGTITAVATLRIIPEDTPGGGDTPGGDNPGGDDTPSGGDTPSDGDTPSGKTYTSFTSGEVDMLTNLVGETIPFLPNDEYYVEVGSDEYGTYIAFYTFGNTKAEFDAYCTTIVSVGYTLVGDGEDEYGDTWYYYEKGDVCIDISFYYYEGEYVVDSYVYLYTEDDGSGDNGNTGGNTGDTKTYTAFTASENQTIIAKVGETIPFLSNNEYYVDEYTLEGENGVNFYTYGNTEAEYNAYRSALVSAGYVLSGSDVDEYGDTWYFYDKGDICIDVAYYNTEDGYVVDLYVYLYTEGDGSGDSGNTGGNTGGGNTDDVDLITNNGLGLPSGTNGVYNIDFSKATNVKNVHDQGYYLDGCPTTGTPKVLVIPVDFADVTASSKGYDIDLIKKAFESNDSTDGFYSVYEYFNISSYGQLTLDFTVLDSWFRPENNSTYYANSTDAEGGMNGDQLIIDEALQYLATTMDLSEFDSDGNSIIDAVVIIHTLDIDDSADFYWAYRYWNTHVDEDGYYYEYDGVSANDYLWASYQFMHESYDEDGNVDYTGTTAFNTYTYVHEFAHVLGADDYYDTAYVNEDLLLDGKDMMDAMFGDHNPYTKFNYGWITPSRLVVAEDSVTLTLTDFGKTGDTIIIANNWSDDLGAYQEYYVLMYYTNTGLNAGDDYGYFSRDGVVVYHVNASLYREVYDGETYYDVYNNNTHSSDQYGTLNNLIEYIKSSNDTFTYIAGDTMGAVTDDSGNALVYNFVVDSINGDTATITFTKTI